MSNIFTNINYDREFLTCLLKEVDDKIAFVSNRDYKNNIYGMGNKDMGVYNDLLTYRDILDKILKCNTCFTDCLEDIKIEDIISKVKLELNNC